MEVVVLDSASQLALHSCQSAALLASTAVPSLLPAIAARALGRSSSPAVRLAALHALASAAGVERAGEARDRSAALLPAAAEEALRQVRGSVGAVDLAVAGVTHRACGLGVIAWCLQYSSIGWHHGMKACMQLVVIQPCVSPSPHYLVIISGREAHLLTLLLPLLLFHAVLVSGGVWCCVWSSWGHWCSTQSSRSSAQHAAATL